MFLNLGIGMLLGVVATLVFLLVLIVWTWQELEEDKEMSEVGRDVGAKTRRWTGGIAGFMSMLTVGVLGGLYEAGMSFADVAAVLGDIFVSAPQFFGGLGVLGLGWLGISGTWSISGPQYVGLGMIVIAVSALVAMRANGDGGII